MKFVTENTAHVYVHDQKPITVCKWEGASLQQKKYTVKPVSYLNSET